jgi:hypothetical protein
MDAEQLNQDLYDKMAAEQERFKHVLLGMSPEEVLTHAYEYAMREDILAEMEELDLPADQAAALLALPYPLADVYREWGKVETHHLEDIRDVIEELASTQVKDREPTCYSPIYRQSGEYAREHGELDAMREQPEQKPSIKAQLAAKPVPSDQPAAKPKDREVR